MADNSGRFIIFGNNGSPYSCKIRSYLRFKRIPFDWCPRTGANWPDKYKHIRPKVIPVVEWPNGFSMNESTKIIQKMENELNTRTIIPNNRCYAFLADLIEDFADEWVTKMMFGMRWNRKVDQEFGSMYIALSFPSNIRKAVANQMKNRQIGRCALVGCDNDDEMHESFHEICNIFESYLSSQNSIFLFGDRVSNADFGMYGQMHQWRADITSDKILRSTYPYTFCWLDKMNDISGINIDNKQFKITKIVMDLLTVCGNVYLPFLNANYIALQTGKKDVVVNLKINGQIITHKQGSFKWQGKCLRVLRKKLADLRGDGSFNELQNILKQTGCWDVLNGSNQSKL